MIMKFKEDSDLKNPKDIKIAFFDFIKNKMKSKYKVENSKSAITLKRVIDNEIKVGFDIVIIKENIHSCEVLKRNDNTYSFQLVKEYADFKNNVKLIRTNYLWPELRREYLEDKIENIKNNSSKKSYLILIQSAKTVVEQNLVIRN